MGCFIPLLKVRPISQHCSAVYFAYTLLLSKLFFSYQTFWLMFMQVKILQNMIRTHVSISTRVPQSRPSELTLARAAVLPCPGVPQGPSLPASPSLGGTAARRGAPHRVLGWAPAALGGCSLAGCPMRHLSTPIGCLSTQHAVSATLLQAGKVPALCPRSLGNAIRVATGTQQ